MINASGEHEGQENREKMSAPANDVYGTLDPNLGAQCIYFYYLTESKIEKEKTQTFFIERDYVITDLAHEIDTIMKDIFVDKTLKPCGWGLGDVRWRRKSYIVVLFDDLVHKLNENDAVTFTPYYSFKGGTDIKTIQGYPRVTGFYCENHMTDSNGGPVGAKGETFDVKVNHDGHHNSSKLKFFTHNDSGTNMGPPLPPP
jgi:hypothetical protein